ncbi:unnamed protein product, partial [Phaeothamnion confervicola]
TGKKLCCFLLPVLNREKRRARQLRHDGLEQREQTTFQQFIWETAYRNGFAGRPLKRKGTPYGVPQWTRYLPRDAPARDGGSYPRRNDEVRHRMPRRHLKSPPTGTRRGEDGAPGGRRPRPCSAPP